MIRLLTAVISMVCLEGKISVIEPVELIDSLTKANVDSRELTRKFGV